MRYIKKAMVMFVAERREVEYCCRKIERNRGEFFEEPTVVMLAHC